MTDDEVLTLRLGLAGVWPDAPWGDGVVAKVGGPPGRIFAAPGDGAAVLKLAPEDCAELRAAYPDHVGDARYVSKRHWVRIALDGAVPDAELSELVRQSYALVVQALPRSQRPAQNPGQVLQLEDPPER